MRPMKKIQDWGVGYFDWVTNGGGVTHKLISLAYYTGKNITLPNLAL